MVPFLYNLSKWYRFFKIVKKIIYRNGKNPFLYDCVQWVMRLLCKWYRENGRRKV